jgi:molecular chaperone GrpE
MGKKKEKMAEEQQNVEAEANPSEEAGTAEAADVDGEQPEPTAEDLTEALEAAKAKADETWEQLVRSRAEVENLRRRHDKELENAHKYALDSFVKELLQVWDSIELGMMAADENADIGKIREGMELTLKLFADTMGKFNVERIDPNGEPFNPDLHQAMSMQPRDDVPANTVVTVVQKGCTLNGRLVRPALVMVSQEPPK